MSVKKLIAQQANSEAAFFKELVKQLGEPKELTALFEDWQKKRNQLLMHTMQQLMNQGRKIEKL